MSALRSCRGLSFVSLILSLLIIFALMAVYLREFTGKGPKGGPEVTAIEVTKQRAQQVEQQQQERLKQMDEVMR